MGAFNRAAIVYCVAAALLVFPGVAALAARRAFAGAALPSDLRLALLFGACCLAALIPAGIAYLLARR